MIKSMTGYGSAKGNAAGFEISVELKSVNNRYLETSVRMPRSFLFAEEAVKSTVQRHISRGKVDVFINVSAVGVDDVKVSVNEEVDSAEEPVSTVNWEQLIRKAESLWSGEPGSSETDFLKRLRAISLIFNVFDIEV